MAASDIRAKVGSFWLNSLEAELLGCIALALADMSESLEDIRQQLQANQMDLRDHVIADHVIARELQPL